MPEPVDKELYESIKKRVYAQRKRNMIKRWKELGKDTRKVTGHSAYAVGQVIREYKRKFKEKHGDRKSPYIGKKNPKQGWRTRFTGDLSDNSVPLLSWDR